MSKKVEISLEENEKDRIFNVEESKLCKKTLVFDQL